MRFEQRMKGIKKQGSELFKKSKLLTLDLQNDKIYTTYSILCDKMKVCNTCLEGSTKVST